MLLLDEVLTAEGLSLAMEVLPILDVVDLANELFCNAFRSLQLLKGLSHHHLEVVVDLLDLGNVDGLQLQVKIDKVSCVKRHLHLPSE